MNSAKSTLNNNVCRDIEKEYGEITMDKLITLNRQIKKGLAEHRRADARWESLLERAFLMEDVISSRQSKEKKIRSTFWIEKSGTLNEIHDTFRKKNILLQNIILLFLKFGIGM